jgi:CheY-like chemotaxis protein
MDLRYFDYLFTSLAMLGGRKKIFSVGCNDYFEKPIDPITIMDRRHQILETKNMNKVSGKRRIFPL